MAQTIPPWFVPILLSALLLGFYDIFKKHAVRDNAVMPVLFLATLAGSALFVAGTLLTGRFGEIAVCTPLWWNLILLKSLLVGASWTLVYYAMRDLPISIASPIRATAPPLDLLRRNAALRRNSDTVAGNRHGGDLRRILPLLSAGKA